MKKIIVGILLILFVAFVAYHIGRSSASGQISTETPVKVAPVPPVERSTLTGKIAFVFKAADGNSHIYIMNADGTGATDIANCLTGECYPSWSPDGSKILFQRSENGAGVYVVNADGSNMQRLSPTPGYDIRPSWSPDGSKIVFNRITNFKAVAQQGAHPETDIVVMNEDGTGAHTILPADGLFSVEPRWSPDGSKITFTSLRAGGYMLQIFTMNPDGTDLKQITHDSINGDPVWSPDGSRISFGSAREGGGKVNIFTMKPDGTDVKQITHVPAPYEAGDTSWSSDGKWITFEWDVNGKGQSDPNAYAEVWIVRSDGTAEPMTTGQQCSGVGCSPRWKPEVVKK